MLAPAKKPLFFSNLFFTRLALISLIALQSLVPHQAHGLTRGEKGGTFLLASLMLSVNKNRLGKSALAEKIAALTNTDSHDLVDASVLSTYYWAWSYLYESIYASSNNPMWRSWATDVRYQATIQPLIQIVATSKIYNKLFKNTPGLKSLACTEKDCPGVCDECEYKHLARKAPLELGAVAAQEYTRQALTRYKAWKRGAGNPAQQRLAAIQAAENQVGLCVICQENDNPVCNLFCENLCGDANMCAACMPNMANRQCPLCRSLVRSPLAPALAAGNAILPEIRFSTLPLTNKLYHLVFWEPFWTVCRQENNFLHRWGLELRKINPLVRRHISCKDRHPHSICHQCKLKKIFHIHDWAKYLKS